MTSPGSGPTEDEREHAAIVVAHLPISIPDYTTTGLDAAAEVIAQAFADQRAKYEAAFAEVEELAAGLSPCNDFWRGNIDGLNNAVRLIRQEVR